MDAIHIKDLKVNCHLGITEREQKKKQQIIMDVSLYFSLKRPGRTDNLKDTIDYRTVAAGILAEVNGKKFYLIEHLAEVIATVVLKDKRVRKTKIVVKKLSALKTYNASFAAVEIMRHG
ncbi:dihydroneopterin aldolase [Candidatus Woesearchaeota archaeon]|nr:dihydroneopterin aldolase [Candidatus Woesearchaeota archaeon]